MRAPSSATKIPFAILVVFVSTCAFSNVFIDEGSMSLRENPQDIFRLNDGHASEEDFSFEVINGTGIKITGYTGSAESVSIPNTIGNIPVTQIGDDAFLNDENIEHLTISENVRNIGKSAFRDCKKLEIAILGDGVKQIRSNAFSGCESLKIIQLKGDAPDTGNKWISGTAKDLVIYYVDGKKNFNSSNWTGLNIVPLTVPSSPVTFNAVPGNSFVELSWSMSVDIKTETILGFNVFYKESENTDWTELLTEDDNIQINSLSNGICYEFRICAVNIAGNGEFSDVVSATPFTIPEAPVARVVEEISETLLIWDVPNNMGSEITGYNVYRDDELIVSKDSMNHEYSIEDPVPGIKYIFQVSARNNAGESPKSNAVEVMFENKYTLFFDTVDGSPVEPIILKSGDPIIVPSVPVKEGCFFREWNPSIPAVMPDHDIIVRAVWDEVVNFPIVNSGLCYTGEFQTGVPAGNGYVLSGNYSMKYAGEYVAYLSLGEGYIWHDGTYESKEVIWKIDPKTVYVYPGKNQFKKYYDEDPVIKYVLSEDVTVKGRLDRMSGENPGVYEIFTGSLKAEDCNYKLKMCEGIVSFEIVAVCPGVPTNPEVIFDEYDVKLQWDAPIFDGGCEICSYEIWFKSDGNHWTLYGTVEDSMTNIILVDSKEEYEFAVKAVNSIGISELSKVISIKTNHVEQHKESVGDIMCENYEEDETVFLSSLFLVLLLCLILMIPRKVG